jgi:glycosyltransferase involved in cell wall biosynthesis
MGEGAARAKPSVVLLAPIAPATTGNGLAMRAGMLVTALAPAADVHVVVVPVSGSTADHAWVTARASSVAVVEPATGSAARDHTTRQLADPELRTRLERTSPLPSRALLAPPTLAATVAAALPRGLGSVGAVLAMRLYLAPLGVQLARELSAGRIVVDADDDDAALLLALGNEEEADAYERLARCWLPVADAALAASAADAEGVAHRARLDASRVHVVPNAIDVPAHPPPRPGDDRLLFLGNLSYEPNRLAARALAETVLPRIRAHRPTATLELVGPLTAGALDDLDRVPGVRVVGAVPDVAPWYARADVVVVPLRHGAGTRIKVLEAFAHRRPVIATSVGVAGLDVEAGREVVIAESPDELARAVCEVLDDPVRGDALVEHAARLVDARYRPEVVAPLVRAAVLGGPVQ